MQVRSQSLSGHQIKQTLLEAPRAQSIPEGTFTWSPPSLTLILPERKPITELQISIHKT
ncbi:hypothetical protein LEMLEM_LOCUS24583 [Lemmus lemmus]